MGKLTDRVAVFIDLNKVKPQCVGQIARGSKLKFDFCGQRAVVGDLQQFSRRSARLPRRFADDGGGVCFQILRGGCKRKCLVTVNARDRTGLSAVAQFVRIRIDQQAACLNGVAFVGGKLGERASPAFKR